MSRSISLLFSVICFSDTTFARSAASFVFSRVSAVAFFSAIAVFFSAIAVFLAMVSPSTSFVSFLIFASRSGTFLASKYRFTSGISEVSSTWKHPVIFPAASFFLSLSDKKSLNSRQGFFWVVTGGFFSSVFVGGGPSPGVGLVVSVAVVLVFSVIGCLLMPLYSSSFSTAGDVVGSAGLAITIGASFEVLLGSAFSAYASRSLVGVVVKASALALLFWLSR